MLIREFDEKEYWAQRIARNMAVAGLLVLDSRSHGNPEPIDGLRPGHCQLH